MGRTVLFGKRARSVKRILIVEDEPLIAFDSEHWLAGKGYEVVATVDSLAAASAIIATEPLDLILTDISLNGDGTGLDVARVAGEHGVAVLFVTGQFPEANEHLGIGCLTKPYSDASLLGAIAAIERQLGGQRVRKLPAGLRLFERVV